MQVKIQKIELSNESKVAIQLVEQNQNHKYSQVLYDCRFLPVRLSAQLMAFTETNGDTIF